jgi:hypothetical protein
MHTIWQSVDHHVDDLSAPEYNTLYTLDLTSLSGYAIAEDACHIHRRQCIGMHMAYVGELVALLLSSPEKL